MPQNCLPYNENAKPKPKIFKNPRNAAAGGLRQLTRVRCDTQHLRSLADQSIKKLGQALCAETVGLRTNPLRRGCQTAESD